MYYYIIYNMTAYMFVLLIQLYVGVSDLWLCLITKLSLCYMFTIKNILVPESMCFYVYVCVCVCVCMCVREFMCVQR